MKKSIFKKWWFWAIVVIIVFAVFNPADDSKEAVSGEDAAPVSVESANIVSDVEHEPEPAELTLDKEIELAIVDAVGAESNTDKERIIDLAVNNHAGTVDPDDKIVIAKLNANENITTRLTRSGILRDSSDVFDSLFDIPEVSEVSITWVLPLSNGDGDVLRISFTKEAWTDFSGDNYADEAGIYWEHPALVD